MKEIFIQITQYFESLGEWGLVLNSFIESFFLVPPPDILLGIMDIAQPSKALYFALICTIASALGGALGYGIGYWGGRPAFFMLFRKNGREHLEAAEKLYEKYGSAAVFFSAFTPVPYKVFTIASGILNMNFFKFMAASFFGRGLRFFIVSAVLMFFGDAVKKYIEPLIIVLTVLIIAFYIIIYKKRRSFVKKEPVQNEVQTEKSEEAEENSCVLS